MNKPQIKNFSVWARRKLIETVSYRMSLIGITEKGIADALPQSTADLKFYDIGTGKPAEVKGKDIAYRSELVSKIGQDGYKNTVEEIAYTWFNRLIAIRFMEVNDYLPARVRVLSSLDSGKSEPDIVTDAISVAEENGFKISADEIYRLKDENKADELFGKMFEFECRQLNSCLPELFGKSANYMEMLLPVSYTDKDGIIYHLVHDIPEDDFNLEKEGQVEIIGWLYQYYNTEPKDTVFANLKKNVKISKENIPAATQLFTPDWIVRYMVENSLGRLWIDGHSDCSAKSEWKYYLEEAEQEESVKAQLEEIRRERSELNPEQIKFIDPCMGSGHILIYAFDVLMQIYTSCGYSERDAARLIIQKNLYGLDIDRRAYQLAYFALMMKARQYDRRFLTREDKVKPNLAHFQGLESVCDATVGGALKELAEQFRNCDTYGSLTEMNEVKGLDEALDDFSGVIGMELDKTERMMTIYKLLSQKYDVVCTNPPYMGGSGMSGALSDFVKKNYPDSKSDLFAVFIERCGQLAKINGFYAMIVQPSLLFLSSFEKVREKIISKNTISSLLHMGRGIFGIDFGSTAFVINKKHISNYLGGYFRLHERTFQYIDPDDIGNLYLMSKGDKTILFDFSTYDTQNEELHLSEKTNKSVQLYHIAKQENFSKIPGAPVAYWVSENFIRAFENGKSIDELANVPKGLSTGSVDRFMRYWFEIKYDAIDFDSISCENSKERGFRWFPYAKGGAYRRWNGNLEYVVNWQNDGFEVKNFVDENGKQRSRPQNTSYYFKRGITYSAITSGLYSVRYIDKCIFGGGGDSIQSKKEEYLFTIMAFLNSNIAQMYLNVISPTMNFEVGHIKKLPLILNSSKITEIDILAKENISLSKNDWDSFETSWDFKKHPLVEKSKALWDATAVGAAMSAYYGKHIEVSCPLELCYLLWQGECNERFNRLKANEEELNRIFIDIYGLQDELTPEVEDKDVTVRKADLQREIKSLISYAVGCMFGRYSLDVEGLAYAGGEWDDSKYSTYIPDKDNCIPITDDYYFEDDIVKRFADFISAVYGEETLEKNLDFIADALGNKGKTSREVIRNYFLNDFYKDHLKIYQKRPIYWLFDSGKQNGFKALIYMHRWNADTIGNVRVEYLHKTQKIYMNELDRMQDTIDNSSDSREIVAATKAKEKLTKQLKETKDYDASMAHLANMRIDIDLDDGVKVNYEKVQTDSEGKNLGILAKI